jgi:hypothetical protein
MCRFYFSQICTSVSQGQNMISVSNLGCAAKMARSNNVYACWLMLFVDRSVECIAWLSLLDCSWDGGQVSAEVSVHRIVSMEHYGHWPLCFALQEFVLLLSYVDSKTGVHIQIPTVGGELNWFLGHLAEQQWKMQEVISGVFGCFDQVSGGKIHVLEYERQLKGPHPITLLMQSAFPPKVNFCTNDLCHVGHVYAGSDFGTLHSLLPLCPSFCSYYLLPSCLRF